MKLHPSMKPDPCDHYASGINHNDGATNFQFRYDGDERYGLAPNPAIVKKITKRPRMTFVHYAPALRRLCDAPLSEGGISQIYDKVTCIECLSLGQFRVHKYGAAKKDRTK